MRERRLPKLWFLTGLFLICMCILMLQVAETRLLSVIAWYYLAFFAISMAMFGMTAGSLVVHFKAAVFTRERLFEHLPWISLALAVSVVASVISLVSSVVFTGLDSGLMSLLWLRLILSILPPYFFAGMAISLALTRSRYPIGQVYGVDLVGGASGCLIVLGLLSYLDGCSVLFAIAAIAALAAAAFRAAWRADAPSQRPLGISNSFPLRHPLVFAMMFAGIAIMNNAIQPHGIRPLVVKDYLEKQIPAAQQWNSFSRIQAGHAITAKPSLWGPSPKLPQLEVSQRFMAIDGSAGTVMYRFDGDLKDLDFLRYDVTNLAFSIRNRGRAAIIGVGGGRDLLSAYLFGFRDVIGVELNPIFVDFLEHRFRDYNHIADLPGVRLHVDEARSWFARTQQKFDLIEMSLVDTWAATGAGAFSLSENGLYTIEAWQHFLDALIADGLFTVSRWYSPDDIRETARLLSLAISSLRLHGEADPGKHIVLASAGHLATIIVSKAPFSADDLGTLHKVCAMLGFMILVSPDQPAAAPVLAEVMSANTPEAVDRLVRTYHIDLRAPKDDRPFFFNQLVLTDLESLKDGVLSSEGAIHGNMQAAKTIGIILVLSLALVLVTMIGPSLPAVRRAPAMLAALGTIYFALIGLGFMFVEISIIQRISLLLGYPTYGLAIGLFSIILSTGIGSLVSEHFPLTTPKRIVAWAVLLALLIVLLTASFPMLAQHFESEGLAVRALAALIATVPSGFLMGFGFPTGMGLVNAIDTRPTPWFWAVNGSAGVLAAGAAVGVSIVFSINVSLWVGAACYIALAPIGVTLRNFAATAVPKQASIQRGCP